MICFVVKELATHPSTELKPFAKPTRRVKRGRCPWRRSGYGAHPVTFLRNLNGSAPHPCFGTRFNNCSIKVGNMAKVAFLGLGVMGFPMAGHLVKKGGHEVTVYNRTAAKAKQWADKFGGGTAATPKAAAEGQDFVMCCVGNDNDLRAVTLGADGAFAG